MVFLTLSNPLRGATLLNSLEQDTLPLVQG
jgi:hypothetical protein